ncbi:MAG: T9SS type A sorting domain-containing protein [Bacteroidota bacterium]
MNKRLTFWLLLLLGAVLLLAQGSSSQVKLIALKVELNGEVKLAWTTPSNGIDTTTVYELYRAKLPDTTAQLILTTTDTSFVDHIPPVISLTPITYAYKIVAKTGILVELSNIVFVPVPGIPEFGAFKLEGHVDSVSVSLHWDAPPVGTVSYYLVFRGHLGDDKPFHTKIDSTVDRLSVTAAPIVSDPDSPVTFIFYVKAVLTTGEVLFSTTRQLTVYAKPTGDKVWFVTRPNPFAKKDTSFEYTAVAQSDNSSAVIRYFAEHYPAGFSIDSVSGTVNWTPTEKGTYKIVLAAKSSFGGKARQEFMISITNGNGVMYGKVTDKSDIGIPNVILEVFRVDEVSNISFAYAAKTDSKGNYWISHIDPGNYKVRANSPSMMFRSVWADTARDVSNARIVIIPDSSEGITQLSIKLRDAGPAPLPVTVSGRVTDTTGTAINGSDSRVVFVRAEFALNFGGGMGIGIENFRKYFEMNMHGDFRLEGNSEFVFKVKTDSLGNYQMKVPPGAYIAFAKAKGYAVEFYNEQPSILAADIIRVPKDTMNINFTLSPMPPVVLGEISGSVIDSVNKVFVPSRVIAFRDGWRFKDIHRIGRVYIADTDSTGTYTLENLLPGNYVILAVPLGEYAPAFYSQDTNNVRWRFASKVEVNGNSIDNINIYVRHFEPSAHGFTAIVGTVSFNGSNGSTNGSLRAGALVYAYRDGVPVGYAFTNAEGKYAITGIGPGEYSIFADKAGFNESMLVNVSASYDGSGNPVNGMANLILNATTSVTVNTSVQPTLYGLEQNYPNPFNPSTTINYSLPKSDRTTLKIYDVLGKEVATLVNEYQQAGQYSVRFTASQLSSGIYFYRLESGSFGIVKKMMFIK